MTIGVVQSVHPEARRIVFENPRLETLPEDNPAVGEIPIFLGKDLRADLLGSLEGSGIGGGLILGSYSIGNGVEFLEAEGFAAAPATGPAGLPFDVGDWEAILAAWGRDHPGALGLGWWLARKGSVTLSRADIAFHEAFFPLTWQVALLIDPSSRTARFHQRKGGVMEECGYFLVQPRRN